MAALPPDDGHADFTTTRVHPSNQFATPDKPIAYRNTSGAGARSGPSPAVEASLKALAANAAGFKKQVAAAEAARKAQTPPTTTLPAKKGQKPPSRFGK